VGWSDRHGFRGNEVGSLQPTPGVLPVSKINGRVKRNLNAP
jgi:hypothetical protein